MSLRQREGHYIVIKGIIHQEGITHPNLYLPILDPQNVQKQKFDQISGRN